MFLITYGRGRRRYFCRRSKKNYRWMVAPYRGQLHSLTKNTQLSLER